MNHPSPGATVGCCPVMAIASALPGAECAFFFGAFCPTPPPCLALCSQHTPPFPLCNVLPSAACCCCSPHVLYLGHISFTSASRKRKANNPTRVPTFIISRYPFKTSSSSCLSPPCLQCSTCSLTKDKTRGGRKAVNLIQNRALPTLSPDLRTPRPPLRWFSEAPSLPRSVCRLRTDSNRGYCPPRPLAFIPCTESNTRSASPRDPD